MFETQFGVLPNLQLCRFHVFRLAASANELCFYAFDKRQPKSVAMRFMVLCREVALSQCLDVIHTAHEHLVQRNDGLAP